jgi:Cu(I)/Ag(I) efflux system membrane protein CusA/SilA
MIERVIDFSVRRRGWVIAAAAAWALCGCWAAFRTPIDAVPDLSENQVLVTADWPGHGPEEVEQQVTSPLSLAAQGVPGVRALRGSSDMGRSTIHLIFEDGVSFDEARRRVQERFTSGQARLPAGVAPRLAAEGIPTGQIFWYTVEGAGFDLSELRALQDWSIAPQLRSLSGVAEVASVGGFIREIQVTADPAKLAAAGLSISDVSAAITASQAAVGGHVVHQGNAEFVVEVGRAASQEQPLSAAVEALEQLVIPAKVGGSVLLGDVARVALGPGTRRGVFEKDGNEVVGGVVHQRYGANTLDVTRRVKDKLKEIRRGLPAEVRVVPCYDRTPLITAAVGTVSRTLIEAMVVAAICVVILLRHVRASLVVAATLPLAVIGAFLGLALLRFAGIADVQTNIMSLAGLVISVGVLVDSSIVMSENAMHSLRRRFGDRPVTGNASAVVARACSTVGRPVFFSILIMLVSFLPVFALSGIDGKMYSPLAWTKSLALISAAILAVTFVPALCAVLIRGRIRDESESWIVRSIVDVYRPVLSLLIDRPAPLVWVLSATLVLAAAALGSKPILLTVLATGMVLAGLIARTGRGRAAVVASLVVLALAADAVMTPLGTQIRLPLDEGMVMDMPITVPRASIEQSADDLKARDMVLCRFPEVAMAVGKAGRAETPFDPAPLDMIETMVEFHRRDRWPKRRLLPADAEEQTRAVWAGLVSARLVKDLPGNDEAFIAGAVERGMIRFDAILREVAHLSIQQFLRSLGPDLGRVLVARLGERLHDRNLLARPLTPGDVAALQPRLDPLRVADLATTNADEAAEELIDEVAALAASQELLRSKVTSSVVTPADVSAVIQDVRRETEQKWAAFLPKLEADLFRRAAPLWTRIAAEELISHTEVTDTRLAEVLQQVYAARYAPRPIAAGGSHHHGGFGGPPSLPLIDPHPKFDALLNSLSEDFAASLTLWSHDPESLAGFGGEMDRALQMPGWTNVWTKPIQNRVDMLATGVNAEVGIRVLGRDLDAVVSASEDIAAALRGIPGAADVVADPIRGKGYLRITPDPARAAAAGVSLGELNEVIEATLAGRVVAEQFSGRERVPIRLKLALNDTPDAESIRRLQIPAHLSARAAATSPGGVTSVTLDQVAEVAVAEGPATIKSENGWPRNYVRLNIRDREPSDFVAEAKRVVASQVALPAGVFVEWTGEYEHAVAARRNLLWLTPIVLGSILLLLYAVYRDWADAFTMLLTVPGALAGGVLCQWLLGYPFSIAVGMGYIACFGMAAATGIVMLVYLREAVERAGGLENLSPAGLKAAVLDGAVHRLRPKLLTEATTIFGLAPMLWSTGVGAEVIRPMAAPVLGGILIADEVIDLLLPILFYHVRRRRLKRLHSIPRGVEFVPSTEPMAFVPGV